MKILFFSRDYTNHDHRWLQAISDAGHQVLFLRLERRGSNHDQRPFPENVRELAWSGGKTEFNWDLAEQLQMELKEILDREKPDLLHAGPLNTASVLAARSEFHPLVQMSWGSDILRFVQENESESAHVREALQAADALIGDCMAVREAAVEIGMPNEAIVDFPWGIDIERFSPGIGDELRKKLGWHENFVILHTRGLSADYGVETIAAGFAKAAKSNAALRLILAGGGEMKDELMDFFAERKLLDWVHFSGQIPQAEQVNYFRAADLYLSGTYSDGSSVSLMEALACAIPVLVSDIAGNREWVKSGREGWLFSSGNSDELAEKILVAANNSAETMHAFGLAGRQMAEIRADWKQNQLGIEKAYAIAIKSNQVSQI